jgi:biotin operon repressor
MAYGESLSVRGELEELLRSGEGADLTGKELGERLGVGSGTVLKWIRQMGLSRYRVKRGGAKHSRSEGVVSSLDAGRGVDFEGIEDSREGVWAHRSRRDYDELWEFGYGLALSSEVRERVLSGGRVGYTGEGSDLDGWESIREYEERRERRRERNRRGLEGREELREILESEGGLELTLEELGEVLGVGWSLVWRWKGEMGYR